jgi:hypothetical protein
MIAARPARAHHASLLLLLLAHPERAGELAPEAWDTTVRVARSAKLLAELGCRIERAGALDRVPSAVRDHMRAARVMVRHTHKMAELELHRLARVLEPLTVSIVLLKGAAYLAQGLPFAEGRWMGDVDIMVPRARIEEVEAALRSAGWAMEPMDAYDERYYREWTHEIPPLRYPRHPMRLDVHHSILQQTARLKPDAQALLAASVPAPDGRFRVLCPEDQLLHASVHLFQDSDCANRLRDIADIDGLVRHFSQDAGFWERLRSRIDLHGLGRPVWYALHFAQRLLGLSLPGDTIWIKAPNPPVRVLMDALVSRALLPPHPDRFPSQGTRLARDLLFIRSHWLRMPPALLARHLAVKAFGRLKSARREPSDRR